MKTKWIILAISIAVLISVSDAKKKKSTENNEASRDRKSNGDSAKLNEASSRHEKAPKARYTNDQKAKDRKTNKKPTEDSTEKTPSSQASVARDREQIVSESVVVEEAEPAPVMDEKPSSTSAEGKSVKVTKKSKSKSTKKTNKESKREEETTTESGPISDQAKELDAETSEKVEL